MKKELQSRATLREWLNQARAALARTEAERQREHAALLACLIELAELRESLRTDEDRARDCARTVLGED